MKKTMLSLLMLAATAANAQYEIKPATAPAPAAQKPQPVIYAAELQLTVRQLSALLERGAEIPAARLDAFAPELAAFDLKVKTALGPELVQELARAEKERDDRERSAAAKKTLQAFRAALQVYYGDKGGVYPKSPALLIPGMLPEIPALHLPDHDLTSKITVIDSKKYDKNLSRAVEDTGGWLYFSNQESENYGLLVLDCSHSEAGGSEFFRY